MNATMNEMMTCSMKGLTTGCFILHMGGHHVGNGPVTCGHHGGGTAEGSSFGILFSLV